MRPTVPVFDLDGTLLDSDRALLDAFVALGVDEREVSFGHVVAEECARLGIDVDAYLAAYDPTGAHPYAGVEAMLAKLDRWAICSNKDGPIGRAELERLGWRPVTAMFSDTFAGPKALGPVITALAVEPAAVLFVGDTAHDRECAASVGATFALAGWNPRAVVESGDVVLAEPDDVFRVLG